MSRFESLHSIVVLNRHLNLNFWRLDTFRLIHNIHMRELH